MVKRLIDKLSERPETVFGVVILSVLAGAWVVLGSQYLIAGVAPYKILEYYMKHHRLT